ncbi:MAG: prolyl-tRNA synthetase associated domain-containing protein [Anaerolineae bacterium]|nr:prolyl-tRNA synthetase associated domain-containing protein [Anaerolineae bacterium]
MDDQHLYQILEKNNIPFHKIVHEPVYTSEQASQRVPANEGAPAKNLFLRDRKGKRYFLVMINENKDLDLNKLAADIGSSRLSFGSPERLSQILGIDPGAVSPLALINDSDHQVELWIDEDLWQASVMQCHPLVNTATLLLKRDDLERFLHVLDCEVHLFFC